MGNPIIPSADIDPNLWYFISVVAFQDPEYSGCVGEPFEAHCCIKGSTLLIKLDVGQCINQIEFCIYSGYTAQRIVNVQGPFASVEQCLEEGCP